jgi:hypothetical protein
MMERTGWFKDSLRVNDRVAIQVNPARNQARRVALLRSLQKADGLSHINWEISRQRCDPIQLLHRV